LETLSSFAAPLSDITLVSGIKSIVNSGNDGQAFLTKMDKFENMSHREGVCPEKQRPMMRR
jgi:hypothetical protein